MGAADIVEHEHQNGIEAWKVLNLHFEPKSQLTLPNLKNKISDMNKETTKTYEGLEKLPKELDRRILPYKERGGAYDESETAIILYTIMHEALKKDVRRCDVMGNFKTLRDHIFEEAAESPEVGSSLKRAGAKKADARGPALPLIHVV